MGRERQRGLDVSIEVAAGSREEVGKELNLSWRFPRPRDSRSIPFGAKPLKYRYSRISTL